MGFFKGDEPEFRQFSTVADWQVDFGKTLTGILGEAAPEMLKRAFEREDQGDILEDFKKYFATPAMRMWQDTIAPIVKEGFNLPGAFYSKDRFKGMQRSGEEFLTTRVNPVLFGALESGRGRELQRQAIIANLLTGGQSLALSPTVSGVMMPGSESEFSQIAGPIAAGVAGAYMGGAFGGGAANIAGSWGAALPSDYYSAGAAYNPAIIY